MKTVPILVCDCGRRLRAPGAVPGRVGRCPSCGGILRVPADPPDEPPPSPSPEPAPAIKKKRKLQPVAQTAIWDGLIAAPSRPEETLGASLGYPLWGATGVASLVIFPPLLCITSFPVLSAINAMSVGNGNIVSLMGLLIFLPASLGLFPVMGFMLLFLGRVLASSALAEVHHPRWPDWELSAMGFGLTRWLWAGLVGGVVGGGPALVYWLRCGNIDPIDVIILAELLAVGAAYALMALLASILHEDLLGANPVTVLLAIWRLGWSYATPCLVAGAAAWACITLLAIALEITNGPLGALAGYAFWLATLYASLVVLRVLGLYYARNARKLGWFRGRTGWNV